MSVDLPDDIIELETESDSINLLLIGESGAGKTPLAASSDRCLILRTEKGTVSAAVRGSKAKVWPCDTWLKFKKAKAWLEKAGREPGGIPFDWVTVDSGTMLQTRLLRHILRTEHKKNPSARDLDIPQIQDHQKWQNELKRTMQELIDLPVNLCVTALPMTVSTEDDEGNSDDNILPQFLGGKGDIAWAMAGMFDLGGRVRLAKVKDGEDTKIVQKVHFTKTGAWWGRDRFEVMKPVETNITLDDILARVNTKMKVKS